MKKVTAAQLFATPKNVRKAEARLERAKLTIAAARERAVEITQRHGAQPLRVRPNVLQRRRLAMRLSRTTNPGAATGPDASPESRGH